ncbi:MAG: hypothetical protein O7B99_15940 [Planctomycetota bacterium]|nr:hypothetical protein [Planctomycetota bacterium]
MTTKSPLDATVKDACRALEAEGVAGPQAVFLMATGVGLLPQRLTEHREVSLGEVSGAGIPPPWRGASLHAGRLGPLAVWLIEDAATDPRAAEPAECWAPGFLCWLAAAAGAEVCVHVSAGGALPTPPPSPPGTEDRPALPVGSFAFVGDHLNLSGTSPLVGIGESTLGPLFPDLTRLHHEGLRHAALSKARELGLEASEAVVACTSGPAIETPAERRMLARAGADVSVQGLAAPLISAAHAGLRCLAIVAVVDAGEGPTRLRELLEAADQLAPSLEDLLIALAPEIEATAARLAKEGT